jgi:hypothetical protein
MTWTYIPMLPYYSNSLELFKKSSEVGSRMGEEPLSGRGCVHLPYIVHKHWTAWVIKLCVDPISVPERESSGIIMVDRQLNKVLVRNITTSGFDTKSNIPWQSEQLVHALEGCQAMVNALAVGFHTGLTDLVLKVMFL